MSANSTTLEEQRAVAVTTPSMRRRIAIFVTTIQTIFFLGHWFVYKTWTAFSARPFSAALPIVLALLSVSFVAASFLGYRYTNGFVRVFYTLSAVWLGALNFFFLAACLCWPIYAVFSLAGVPQWRPLIVYVLYGAAALIAIAGVINARIIRVKKVDVRLPNLPESWQGRVAVQVSDLHLGHVNSAGFMRRIVRKLQALEPDIVFITGDLYDGSKVEAAAVVAPWKELATPFGVYFITGNHEEFTDPGKYLDAVNDTGIRVLHNEKVVVDGLQVVGVHYGSSGASRLRPVLDRIGISRDRASILLSHEPHALPIAEEAGISLQLSGHTHGGQVFPITYFTRRIFKEFTYGLQRFGDMLVYTTTGAGTWGPPMRVGTRPEIVLIEFE